MPSVAWKMARTISKGLIVISKYNYYMKRIVALLCLFIVCCSTAWGVEESSSMRKHVIVAFDGASDVSLKQGAVKEIVLDKLFGQCGLVNAGDRISVVCAAGNSRRYNEPIVKVRMKWREAGEKTKQELINKWDSYTRCDWFTGPMEIYSLLSISKSYIIDSLKFAPDDDEYVDQTLILYVTDNMYNGCNDYYGESLYYLNNIVNKPDMEFYKELHKLMDVCANIAQEYTIKYVSGDRFRFDWRYLYCDVFELVPNHQSINLPSVISTQPIIEAKRQARGKYSFSVDMKSYNSDFDILKIEAYGCGEDEKRLLYVNDGLVLGESDIITGEFHVANPYTKLCLECVVHINESVYGATRLRLNHEIDIVIEPDATIFFGNIRLPNFIWLPWCDNQYEVAIHVDIILTILAIIAFVIYVLCRRNYVPKDQDITMGFYDSKN